MSTPPPKVIGRRLAPGTVALIVTGVVGVVLGYLVIQGAAYIETGQWLRGGWNPGTVVAYWVSSGVRVGLWHGLLGLAGLLLVLGGTWLVMNLWTRLRGRKPSIDKSARYLGEATAFSEAKVRQHAADAGLTTGETVGLAVAKMVRGGKWFWAGFRDGLTCIMGPGSGKTVAVVVPLALDAPGAVWVTSNRPDVAAALYTSRVAQGAFWCFDPQGVAGQEPSFFYDPLSYIRVDPDQADVRSAKLATQFAEAGRPADAKTDAYFEPAGTTLVGNFLLAAALEHLPISRVLSWCSLPENKRAVEILEKHEHHDSADQVRGVQALPHETRGSIFQAAANQIRFLKNRSARPWVERMGSTDLRSEFHPEEYVRSRDTFVCLSREGVGSFGPLIAAMTNATIEAAEDYAKTQANGRLPVPFALLLDEVANVCRMQSLPDLMSHAGGRGIFIVPILQSPGQGKATWGPHGWDKLWGASVIRLVGRGLIDTDFLEGVSKAAGDQDVQRISHSKSSGRGGGSRSSNTGWTTERVLPVADLVALPQWRAVAIGAGERPALLELVPYFARDDMAAIVNRSKRDFAARHPEVELDSGAAQAVDAA